MKYAHLLTLLCRIVLVKEMQRFVTWLCFLHHAKEWRLLGLARRIEAASLYSYNPLFSFRAKFYIHLTDGIEQVYRIYLTTVVDRTPWSYFFNHSEIMINVESICQFARCDVLTAVLLNVQVFWNVTPCLREQITARRNITS